LTEPPQQIKKSEDSSPPTFLQLQLHTKERIIDEEHLISNITTGGKAVAYGKKKNKDHLVKKTKDSLPQIPIS
jgi:hypothetical protein